MRPHTQPIKSLQLANKVQLQVLSQLLVDRSSMEELKLPDFEVDSVKNEIEQHAFYMEQITSCIRMSVEIQKTLLTIGVQARYGRVETQETSVSQEESQPEPTEM